MNIAIVGGTGFVGKQLVKHCLQSGHHVFLFSRSPGQGSNHQHPFLTVLPWPLTEKSQVKADAMINLAGETINQRWTSSAKKGILESRIQVTRKIVESIQNGRIQVKTLINASAVGYYGNSADRIFTEEDQGGLEDFLAKVTYQWEREANRAKAFDVRVIKARLGVVLGNEGGALEKMVMPYRLFFGGPIGKGSQWLSWIHIQDAVQLMIHCIENQSVEGAVNFTAPQPVTMDQLGRAIGAAMKRPHWLPAPSFLFKAIFGEMSDLLLKGQHVLPQKAINSGYSFLYPEIGKALNNILVSQ